jgi:hypothetical protein
MRLNQLINPVTKIAGYKLPGTIDAWNEEILKRFFEENNSIPKEYGVEIRLKETDENRGYGIGSVIVWHNNNRINFPIIINQNSLSPFDVFYSNKNGRKEAYPATEENILKELCVYNVGKPENYNKNLTPDLKLVGGVPQRNITRADEQSTGQANFPSIEKMAAPNVYFYKFINKDDLSKIASDLILNPEIAKNFYDNTGGLINKIIKYNGYQKFTPKRHFIGKIDTTGLYDIKKQIVMIDNEFIDKRQFNEILPGTVCELRCKTYGSMEDILSLDDLKEDKLKMGEPVVGVVLKEIGVEDPNDFGLVHAGHVFISSTSNIFCNANTTQWNRNLEKYIPNRFYGTPLNISIDVVINAIKDNTFKIPGRNHPQQSAEYYRREYPDDGNKYTNAIEYSRCNRCHLLTKADNEYVLIPMNSKFDQLLYNGNYIFKGDTTVFIVANVENIVKVSRIDDVTLKSLVGNAKYFYLIPQSSFLIPFGKNGFKRIEYSNFISPDNTIRNDFVNEPVEKIGVKMRNDGVILSGKPIDELRKVANIKDVIDPTVAKKILIDHGVPENKVMPLFKLAAQAFLDGGDYPVYAYNVSSCIYNTKMINDINAMEKRALDYSNIINQYINLMKTDSILGGTIKMASLLTDQNAVDVVLSVDYINEDNIEHFVENMDMIKETLKNIADMLIASRMGLKVLDEENLKKCMKCLDSIIKGLENLKSSIQA